MKRCHECRNPDGSLVHPSSVGCHWLDADVICRHCGSDLAWFRGSPAGDLMDEMSLSAAALIEEEQA